MKTSFPIVGMHCASCALNIEWELEDKGAKATCNYAKELLEIETDFEKLTEQEIKRVVERIGYKIAPTS